MVGRMNHTALFAANRGYALSNSRAGLIRHFLVSGWNVVLATTDDKDSRQLVDLGAHLEPVDFNRGGLVLTSDARAYRRMVQICRTWKPDMIQHFNAKPSITGTIAARRVLGGKVRIFNTVTGLGHAFITGGLAAKIAGLGYKLSLPMSDATVFQNSDDRALFLNNSWLSEKQARLIIGSGVELQQYRFVNRTDRVHTEPVIVMVGRLLRQKGISEFVEVARRIREQWPASRFLLAGEEDVIHPDAVGADWIRKQHAVEYLGRLSDVAALYEKADILLFPSYREGMPRVVMEAAATGLPTVAFDVPGVREAIRNGETGYLCPMHDVDALVACVGELIIDPVRRLEMGRSARQYAESAFNIDSVQEQYLELYREAAMVI